LNLKIQTIIFDLKKKNNILIEENKKLKNENNEMKRTNFYQSYLCMNPENFNI